jgi:hypothetical protein
MIVAVCFAPEPILCPRDRLDGCQDRQDESHGGTCLE